MLFLCVGVLMSSMESVSNNCPMVDTIESNTGNVFDTYPERAESNRENENIDNESRRSGADDFGRAVSKIAIAQICKSVGFQGFRESALEGLADIAIKYLCDLGKTACFYANLAGRTKCNVLDIIIGLEDLGTSRGFPVASEDSRCLAGSGMLSEIVEYADSVEEIPCAQPVSRFPVIRVSRVIPSFMQMGEMPPSKHIPAWLPALPDLHTYVHTSTWNERSSDPREDKIEQARLQRKAERSLLRLQQRLAGNNSVKTSVSIVPINEANELQPKYNPFHKAPQQPGEMVVSAVEVKLSDDMAGENHVSVLQVFAPAIEAVKSAVCDEGEDERNFLPHKRPAVHFKFNNGKKFVGESLDLSLRNKGERAVLWMARDEERDDKKRRAEYILRQSMENPLELMQM